MNRITLKAYAKINLSLDVIGLREDRYHDIESFMQGVDLYDLVTLEQSKGGEACGLEIELVQNVSGLPTDERNLAVKAARTFERAFASKCEILQKNGEKLQSRGEILQQPCEKLQPRGETSQQTCEKLQSRGETSRLKISIDKRLPIAAGIAGGSGNAAAVLLGMNALVGNPFSLRELMAIGRDIGADVPFSVFMNAARNRAVLGGSTEGGLDGTVSDKRAVTTGGLEGIEEARAAAITGGIGDIVTATEPIHKYVIMMNPGVPVSTADVYKAIDGLPEEQRRRRGLWANMMEEWTLRNVAEAAALKEAMQAKLRAERVLMSGSGPTIVAFYDDEELAKEDFKSVDEWAEREWRAWLTESGKE